MSDAAKMTFAAAGGKGFPAEVRDTPKNRAMFAGIKRDVDNMPVGVVPDIPWDYNDDSAGEEGTAQ